MLVLLVLLSFFTVSSSQKFTRLEEFLAQPITKEAEQLTGEALVEYVNNRQSFFKAKYSPEVVKKRRQFLLKPQFIERSYNQENVLPIANITSNDDIPESFDSREKWKDCPSLRVIPDQSNCGSCWAVSAAQCMSDRLCIHSQGRKKVLLSATDILACCGKFCGYGCDGGYNARAWKWATIAGVVTGGAYKEKGNCKPYVFPQCGAHKGKAFNNCPSHPYATPACKPYCQYGYGKRYENDKIKARTWYWLPNDERTIQLEIMQKGPVHATFNIYEDFEHYEGGVYIHTAGAMEGGHSIKIIGWGVDKGVKYWLIANSWSTDWGEDGGYFRVVRGINNCDIEGGVLAGTF
ncbi:hypothetical protein V3C99_005964 [Haemonchus contortus]|uniref:Cathepsin B-like cysteine protease GCP7 n=1 Tax=Haemonchus contortus TaxID=6289 RepID=O61515_HAECO|nr:cathepsin B-like cysteine protease GCP7 [Haemonchus contortus]